MEDEVVTCDMIGPMFSQNRRRSSPFGKLHHFGMSRALRWALAVWILILPVLAAWFSPGAASASRAQVTTTPTNTSPSATSGTPEKVPVVTSTPAADGSIVHIVEQGQTLWDIATAYGINIADLMSLNGLTEKTVIYPGWKLYIQRPNRTPTSLPTDTSTPRPPPPTRPPTRTPAPTQTRTPVLTGATDAAALSGTATAEMANLAIDVRRDPLLMIIVVLAIAGAGLVLAGSLLKRGG